MAAVSIAEQLKTKKANIEVELSKSEKRVYELETSYMMAEFSQSGSVLKGFEGFLSSKDNMRKRARTFKLEDRLFSLSSNTSPAAVEMDQQANDNDRNEAAQPGRGKTSFARQNSRNNLR